MNIKKIDFIILGGGCSALSLINNILKKEKNNYSFVIIEKRQKYIDDRSWCFWDKNESKYSKLSESNWSNFTFSYKKKTSTLISNRYKYFYIRSSKFYDTSIKAISEHKNITLKLNESVLDVKKIENGYLVTTDKENYIGKNILDTRNNKNIFKKNPFLYQLFICYEIKSKTINKYEVNKAYIMHNMNANKNFFYFDYILPIKKNNFLYEFTVFTKRKLSKAYLENILIKKLKKLSLKKHEIIRKEFGVIPMGFINRNALSKQKRFYYAGTSAGAVRPSSGYAFLRIQKWAEKAASTINQKGYLISHPKEKFFSLVLDRIFLKIISSNIKKTAEIFFHFSKNINADSFVRFMSGNANFIDYLKVILAMPTKTVIKCLIKK